MGNRKKIVLLLVEGEADEAALAPLIKKILQREDLLVKLCNGDLTSQVYTSKDKNIITEIGRVISEFIKFNKIKKSDIVKIIHVIDMDGAYIAEEYACEGENESFKYLDNCIMVNNKERIIRRNQGKSKAIDRLIGKNEIMDIPYKVYYMSCNLDHVLYNERNLDACKKVDMADDFADSFLDNIEGFIKFFNEKNLIFQGNYDDSWKQIKLELNSLQRHSNLHFFLNEYTE